MNQPALSNWFSTYVEAVEAGLPRNPGKKIQLMITEKSHFCWLETTCFQVDVRKFNGLEKILALRSSATMLVWQCPRFGSCLTSK